MTKTFYPTTDGQEVDIWVVEDERLSRLALAMLLVGEGYTTSTFESAEEAVNLLSVSRTPRVALIDLDLPGMSGADLLAYLARIAPLIHTVLLTAAGEERLALVIRETNVQYLRKPFQFKELLQIVKEHIAAN